MSDKPAYRIPSMDEIARIPWNGYNVVSTFSGCGGSCLGYRMAGFRILWANEFVPAAQDSYEANKASDCYLDRRDIRNIEAQDILAQIGLQQGEVDLFDGSPPCQAFSTSGKRERGWGKAKTYEHGTRQCNELLFAEYIRLLRGLMPRVFVAENVTGLVKGTVKGMFLDILRDLKASGYRVECRILDAQWLGVPQRRRRTIFIGIRDDLDSYPVYPKPLPYYYSVRDALPEIGYLSARSGTRYLRRPIATDGAMITIFAMGQMQRILAEDLHPCRRTVTSDDSFGSRGIVKRKFTIAELKRICAFPDDFILTGSYAQQWERLGNSVPPLMMYHVARTIRDEILTPRVARALAS